MNLLSTSRHDVGVFDATDDHDGFHREHVVKLSVQSAFPICDITLHGFL